MISEAYNVRGLRFEKQGWKKNCCPLRSVVDIVRLLDCKDDIANNLSKESLSEN